MRAVDDRGSTESPSLDNHRQYQVGAGVRRHSNIHPRMGPYQPTDASVGSEGLISIPDREVANKQSGTFATAVNRHPNLLGPI